MSYTREQCLNWIRDPTQNPKTGKPFNDDRDLFLVLREKCQKLLTPQEIEKNNPEMVPIIFSSSTSQPQISVSTQLKTKESAPKSDEEQEQEIDESAPKSDTSDTSD